MSEHIVFPAGLTPDDRLVLQELVADLGNQPTDVKDLQDSTSVSGSAGSAADTARASSRALYAGKVYPTVFTTWDLSSFDRKTTFYRWLLGPYISKARSIVRTSTDVVMVTHLLLYFTTSLPSAIILYFRDFRWSHGLAHLLMQATYVGTYTLMMHQHIHGAGILSKKFALLDRLFPYITDPLMGHTWNTYFYHHIKHHHVEGNGPLDLSSTLRYQRDSLRDFLTYVSRFFFLIWCDLPVYFIAKQRYALACKAAFWELANYACYTLLFRANARATFCVFLAPLLIMRLGLMAGNWGQHSFISHDEPNSDYRSSITLIDVQVSLHRCLA